MSELPEKALLRPDEVANFFDVKLRTIYSWIDQGKLEAVKIGGTIRIKRQAVIDAQKPVLD